ncbi:hypothetical protein F53441_7311 [Fusarium austroafricanum]|uniref:Uncharacterized protein n=1 Tax=Fusarium austroafricanum TaxID=2364996 RepID=A0A8H4KGU8_9HYPO|nr:hypothetical protein F53441_7311 [Fusarium austroafricanum]
MSANQPLNDAIIIGIDFGTTRRVAYSREPEEIEMVTSWESELNHCSDVEKVPTQLYFEESGRGIKWGYAISPDKEPLKWFKLLLLEPRDTPSGVASSTQIQEARRLVNNSNKTPVKIVSIFLRRLWNHSMEAIRRSIGEDVMNRSKFRVVITLPAIWPPYAQQRMKEAAQQSGMLNQRSAGTTTLHFVSEPEAAALATIKDLSKRSSIKVGDTIVVCDAGGGTVDLISYVFLSTDPFVVKECVKGGGDLCGGVFLDEAFMRFIKNKSRECTWNAVKKSDKRKFLNDQWEHGIKPQFENQRRTWPLDLPENCVRTQSQGLRRRVTLELTSNELLSVFSPIIDKVVNLVSRQVNAIQGKHHEKPKSRGNKPWTAVCRGAVVQGLARHDPTSSLGMSVQARVARMSYGINSTTTFTPGVHAEQDKRWCVKKEAYQAYNQMVWFLTEGDDVSEKRSVYHNYHYLVEGTAVSITETIYCSATLPPPARFDPNTVQRLCEIRWNKTINANNLPKYTNPSQLTFPKLIYRIRMNCEDETVGFVIHHDGSRVGEQNVEVQFNYIKPDMKLYQRPRAPLGNVQIWAS